ncbi:MAG TPA: sulfatase-like hydrolase/transferase [Solirubrobacteraceae bacterium]|nr:sulfatase-like hydrolase/transferase [Solirubrobacteraceae bacterium]
MDTEGEARVDPANSGDSSDSPSEREQDGITRGELLKSAAVAAPAVLLGTEAAAAAAQVNRRVHRPPHGNDVAGMNILVFVTDQQRAVQHFPPGWVARNMPALTYVQRTGLTFENAFTNACMCSPARSTFLSGYFPAQHGVKYTLEENMPASEGYPQVPLSTHFKNPATVVAAAGYTPVYKGKFHCVKQTDNQGWVPSDVNQYGFTRWDPPDAGADTTLPQAGGPPGGPYDNDGRFMHDNGPPWAGDEGVIEYLESHAHRQQPFFLVASLVNPHDVLFYPGQLEASEYTQRWLQGEIKLPATVNEDLSTKPTVQKQFLHLFNAVPNNALTTPEMKRTYLNFYGNLMRSSDFYLQQILRTLKRRGMLDNTLVIVTADHGEMGLTHGGLRQKNFNFYEETLRVPLVYSNPRLFKRPQRSQALVSHVDFLPTLASLVGAPKRARADWQGVDYSDQILSRSPKPPQDYVVFTYDDFQSGQANGPYPGLPPFKPSPNHIVSIRERRYKLARYHAPHRPHVQDQWEMYDLKSDPLETINIASPQHHRTPAQKAEFLRLKAKLEHVEATRLQPL